MPDPSVRLKLKDLAADLPITEAPQQKRLEDLLQGWPSWPNLRAKTQRELAVKMVRLISVLLIGCLSLIFLELGLSSLLSFMDAFTAFPIEVDRSIARKDVFDALNNVLDKGLTALTPLLGSALGFFYGTTRSDNSKA